MALADGVEGRGPLPPKCRRWSVGLSLRMARQERMRSELGRESSELEQMKGELKKVGRRLDRCEAGTTSSKPEMAQEGL